MKIQVFLALCLASAVLARPKDIIDIEQDHMEHEQEGQAGTAVEGEYSWTAPTGEEFMVKYVADHMGYRVVDSNVVPEILAVDPDANEIVEVVPEVEVPQVRAVEVIEEPVVLDPLVEADEEEEEEKARIAAPVDVAPEDTPADRKDAEGNIPEAEISFPEAASPDKEVVGKAGDEAPVAPSADVETEVDDSPAEAPPQARELDTEEEGAEEGTSERRALDPNAEEDDDDDDEVPLSRSSDLNEEAEEEEDDK